MSDNITIKRIATVHPKLRSELADIITAINNAGVGIRVTFALRTNAEQSALYDKFLKGGPKAAPPGLSYHEYGMAIDFCLYHTDGTISFSMTEDLDNDKISDWQEVLNVFAAKGWKNGASFGDNDHCEKAFGLTVNQLRQLKNMGKVDVNGYVII